MFDPEAEKLYMRTYKQGWSGRVWSTLTGRSRHLLALTELDAVCTVGARRDTGIRTVPIGQIRGSEGRSSDFDRDFNPLQNRNRDRWLSVATARHRGKALPPVKLIRVGDVYFIRDGHHRISVARALGQLDIEAEVTVWQVNESLPWERTAAPHSLAGLEMEIERLYERFLLSIRALLPAVGAKLKMRIASQASVSNS